MSLTTNAASGVRVTALSTITTTGLYALQLIVLARLLSPEIFGIMAMLDIVMGFARLYSDIGIGAAIIYRQYPKPKELSSLYWFGIIIGIFIYIILLISRPLIVDFFNEPQLYSYIGIVGLIFIIAPGGQMYQVLLQKDLKFLRLSISDIVSAFIGTIIAISLALSGYGLLSLILGEISRVAVRAILYVILGRDIWKPSFHFRSSELKGYVSFGLYEMGSRSINYINQRLDQILIGTMLNAQYLGYYNLAFNIVITPYLRINPILTKVAFPLFAKVQNEIDRLKRGYMKLMNTTAFINFPILFFIIATSPTFVPLILGTKWIPAIPLIQILAGVALVRSTQNPVGSLLLSKGRADYGFYWNVIILLTQTPLLYIASLSGNVYFLSITLLILWVVYFFAGYYFLIRSLLGDCFRKYLESLSHPFYYSIMIAMLTIVLPYLLDAPRLIVLIAQMIIGLFLYILFNWLGNRGEMMANLRLLTGYNR